MRGRQGAPGVALQLRAGPVRRPVIIIIIITIIVMLNILVIVLV